MWILSASAIDGTPGRFVAYGDIIVPCNICPFTPCTYRTLTRRFDMKTAFGKACSTTVTLHFLRWKKIHSHMENKESSFGEIGQSRCTPSITNCPLALVRNITEVEKKMGYWPSVTWSQVLSLRVILFVSVHNTQKKNEAILQPSWPKNEKFFLRDQGRNPECAVSHHLAPSGSQSELGIWFILLAHGASHVIITAY